MNSLIFQKITILNNHKDIGIGILYLFFALFSGFYGILEKNLESRINIGFRILLKIYANTKAWIERKLQVDPVFGEIRRQVVMASLLLILVKLTLPTSFALRLFLIPFFLVLSLSYNYRDKIKPWLIKVLKILLGYERYTANISTFIPEDLAHNWYIIPFIVYGKSSIWHLILNRYTYKMKLVFNTLFFYCFSLLTFSRLIIDRNIHKYIVLYWIFSWFIVFLDQSPLLSIFGLVMIFSRLSFYITSDSYGEFLSRIEKENPRLQEGTLLANYQNIVTTGLIGIEQFEQLSLLRLQKSWYKYRNIKNIFFILDHAKYHNYFDYKSSDMSFPFIFQAKDFQKRATFYKNARSHFAINSTS